MSVIYRELLEPGKTINAERYCNKLLKRNKKELRPYSVHSIFHGFLHHILPFAKMKY